MNIITRREKAMAEVIDRVEEVLENGDHHNMLEKRVNDKFHQQSLNILRKYRSDEKV